MFLAICLSKLAEQKQKKQQHSVGVMNREEERQRPRRLSQSQSRPSPYTNKVVVDEQTPTLFREKIKATMKYDWWEVLFYESHWSKMVTSYKAELNFLSITFSLIAAMTYPIVFLSFDEITNSWIKNMLFVSIALGFISSLAALIFVMHGFVAVNLCTTAREVEVFFTKTMFVIFLNNLSLMKLIEMMTRLCLYSCIMSCCLYAYGMYSTTVAVVVTVIAAVLSMIVLGVNLTWEVNLHNVLENKRQYHLDVMKSSPEHIEYTESLYKILYDLDAEGFFGTIYMHCPEPSDLQELLNLRTLEICQLLDMPFHIVNKLKYAFESKEKETEREMAYIKQHHHHHHHQHHHDHRIDSGGGNNDNHNIKGPHYNTSSEKIATFDESCDNSLKMDRYLSPEPVMRTRVESF